MKHRMVGISVLVVLGGCAVTLPKKATHDVGVPDQFRHAEVDSHALITDMWWLDFSSDTLNQLVSRAIGINPSLDIAMARLDQAAAQAQIVGADIKPEIGVSLAGSRRKQNFIGLPIPGNEDNVLSSTTTSWNSALNISWEVDMWGRLKLQEKAAIQGFQAAQADFEAARLSLVGQVIKAYFTALEADQALDLARETLASYQTDRDQITKRYKMGVRPSLDLRLAEANYATAAALLEQRAVARDQSVRVLQVLCGLFPDASLRIPKELPSLPNQIPSALPSELVARRPDLTSAYLRVLASESSLESSQRTRYPRFSLSASLGTGTDSLSEILNSNFSVWSLLGNILQPVFQGGRIRASILLANAQMAQMDAQFRDLLMRAYSEVERHLSQEQHWESRITHIQYATDQSVAAASLAEDRYLRGLTPYATVLESQRRLLNAQSDLISARRTQLENRVDLYLALGGGFQQQSGEERKPSHAQP